MPGSEEDGDMEVSIRSAGRRWMSKNTFGQSQNLGQKCLRKLRGTISNESDTPGDGEEHHEEESKDDDKEVRKEGGNGEKRREQSKVAGKSDDGVGGGKLDTLAETDGEREAKVGAIGERNTKGMNEYLWGLGEKRFQAGCDTSLAPSKDNQPTGGGGGQHHLFRDATAKVLAARDIIDRKSVLEYSAVVGKAEHFHDLARWIRWKLDVAGLVNQLRSPDMNCAPLLFQAATTSSCFQAATKVILDTLGVGGLTQQVRAVDRKGKTLLMYVARFGKDVEVFESAHELVKYVSSEEQSRIHLKATDGEERTLLHHAAEGRSEKMLSTVIKAIKHADADKSTWKSLRNSEDRKGWTPAHCALGRRGTPEKIRHDGLHELRRRSIREEALHQNLSDLLSAHPSRDETASGGDDRAINSTAAPTEIQCSSRHLSLGSLKPRLSGLPLHGDGEEQDPTGECGALIELVYAARGGDKAFSYVLRFIEERQDNADGGAEAGENEAKTQDSPPPDEKPNRLLLEVLRRGKEEEFEQRCTMLFAQAALGGDLDVLEHVEKTLLPAIPAAPSNNKRSYWATKTDYPMHESDITRAARLAYMAGEYDCSDDRVDIDFEWYKSKPGTDTDSNKGRQTFTASLFTLAVLSGSEPAVRWVAKYVRKSTDQVWDVWNILRGKGSEVSSLTYAAVASGSRGDGEVFDAVCDVLRRAAKACCADGADGAAREADRLFRGELLQPGSNSAGVSQDEMSRNRLILTPLAAAAFSGKDSMFDTVLGTYKRGILHSNGGGGDGGGDDAKSGTDRQFPKDKIIAQIKAVLPHMKYLRRLWASGEGGGTPPGIVPDEVSPLLKGCYGSEALKSAVDNVAEWEQRNVPNRSEDWLSTVVKEADLDDPIGEAKKAAKQGAFDGLKRLIEKGWYCHKYIATIISGIADYEDGVIDTILCAVENSSNPFVTSAIASTCIRSRARYHPRDRNGLTRLHGEIDALSTELLDKLPHTVRGVGLELLGSFAYLNDDAKQQSMADASTTQGDTILRKRRQAIRASLVGFIAVRWMLEPSLNNSPMDGDRSDVESEASSQKDLDPLLDPLQQALNNGSVAHAFINAPLVLDYMELKWSCTVPSWTRRTPLDYTTYEGFYTYRDISTDGDGPQHDKNTDASVFWRRLYNSLLWLLQGWDRQEMMAPRPAEGSTFQDFPHTTVLPGLQFILAGLIGKPDMFFLVPCVRFMFETICYLFMLGLYVSSATIDESDAIPPNEIIFYIFAAGLMWREILEFRDGMPRPTPKSIPEGKHEAMTAESVTTVVGASELPPHRGTTGVKRYFTKDNWNILDTASILFVLITFVCRMVAYIASSSTTADDITGEFLFAARFFLAALAPLLGARVLSLAQVDNTLGPMTQIIWAMLFHLVRFSLFMLVVMCSFALAFHSLYSSPTCGDGDELYEVYHTFDDSLLDMFRAMLGDTSFDRFEVSRNPSCDSPSWNFDAGILMLVTYIVIMAILMLNLLIAILSTVHDEVSENSITEFHLARCQFIQASARGVEKGLLPPPFNLFMALLLVVVDFVDEVWHLPGKCARCFRCTDGKASGETGPRQGNPAGVAPAADINGTAPHGRQANNSEVNLNQSAGRGSGGGSQDARNGVVDSAGDHNSGSNSSSNSSSKDASQPWSGSPRMKTLRGGLERLLFACTMGLFAVAVNALLWTVSLPSVAGRIVRWMMAKEDKKDRLPSKQPGYFRPLIFGVFGLFASLVGLLVAVVFCSSCIVLSVVLWCRGVWGIFEWVALERENEAPKQVKKKGSSDVFPLFPQTGKGAVMPGALRTARGLWRDATKVVEASNHGPSKEKESMRGGLLSRRSEAYPAELRRHFHLEALLKMTTGWSLGHLSSLVRLKEEKSTKEEEMLREIDDKTPHRL